MADADGRLEPLPQSPAKPGGGGAGRGRDEPDESAQAAERSTWPRAPARLLDKMSRSVRSMRMFSERNLGRLSERNLGRFSERNLGSGPGVGRPKMSRRRSIVLQIDGTLSQTIQRIKAFSDGDAAGRSRVESPLPRASRVGGRRSKVRKGPVHIFDRMSQSIVTRKTLTKKNFVGRLAHGSRRMTMDHTLFSPRTASLIESRKAFSDRKSTGDRDKRLGTMMEGPDEDRESEAGSPTRPSAPTTAADIGEQLDNLIRGGEAPAAVIDEPSQSLGGRKLFEDGDVHRHSIAEAGDRRLSNIHRYAAETPQSSDHSLFDSFGPLSEKELMEAEFIWQHFKMFSAMLILEVFGGTGAVWGFSEVLTLRNPATVWFWRPVSLAFGVLFFFRWMKEVYDYYAEEDLGFFGDGAKSAPNDDNKTMGSGKTAETENEQNSLIGSQVTFGDPVESSRSDKYVDWGHEPSEKPNEIYRIFGAKLVLEVFGGSGAIWGFSEILTLRYAADDWFWRPVALGFAAVFAIRWILQIRDYRAEGPPAEIDPRTRLYQVFSAKLVLEVFGGAGAVWGFTDALAVRDSANAWFWRPVVLAFGAIFFFRWGMQIREYCAEEYCAEEHLEVVDEEGAAQEGERTPLLPTKARGA